MSTVRPGSAAPAWVCMLLVASLAAQLLWQARLGGSGAPAVDLPPAPSAGILRAASLGEPEAAARLAMLYVQSFDLRGENAISYQRLDYTRLAAWLQAILDTDPRSEYALFSAARIYAENRYPAKCRAMLEFVHREFYKDPNRRWPWLAHAALVAKHRLKDLRLAYQYARAIDRYTTDPNVPFWAKQMDIFILEDMNEMEAAKIMLGGLIASGRVRDRAELRFLQHRLNELEQRLAPPIRR